MGKIKLLSRELSDIIAAGEVISDTASLLKELIENSLDAKATSIEIHISNDARNIKIKDNGEGMTLEDLEICTKRHATSKINSKEDLFNIKTYGFRGEALSSIASISKMYIATKQRESNEGHKIYLDAGEIVSKEITKQSVGTEIAIFDLFFNVPARLKFLKTIKSENNKIKDITLKEALVNSGVSFSLYIDDALKLKSSGKGIENTIIELFNVNVLKALHKFDLGFLGNSSLVRSSRDCIFTYFNGRYAKSPMVDKAIIDAYYTRLEKGKYPFVILFLDIDPREIDVNVHPSKKTVKFTNDKAIYLHVRKRVEEALNAIDRTIVTLAIDSDKIVSISNVKNIDNMKIGNTNKSNSMVNNLNEKRNFESSPSLDNFIQNVKNEQKVENKKIPLGEDVDYFVENRFVGQIFNTFSVVECKGRIEIYDNHIVQERLLYDEIREKHDKKKIISQALLVPIKVSLSKLDKDRALDNIDFFKEYGFEVEDFGGDEVVLRKVPLFKFTDSYNNIFKDLISLVRSEGIKDIREKVIVTMSCRQSIKAGDRVDDEEMKVLINRLHKNKRYSCPHGRNIILELSDKYIEKHFKRG